MGSKNIIICGVILKSLCNKNGMHSLVVNSFKYMFLNVKFMSLEHIDSRYE